MKTETETSVPAASDHAPTLDLLTELRDRLHRGDHLAVAADYLAGRLSCDSSSWRQASLIGLAMHHHLEALDASGGSKIGFEASQFDNGLAVTVDWPNAEEIDQVIVTAEVTDANGNTRVIVEPFSRAGESGGFTARLRASTLASQQTVVIRPLDDAANVDVAVQAGHRLRFDAARLTPHLRWSQAGEAAREQRSIAFRPSREPTRRQVDVYGDFQASNPTTALEIVTVEQILEEARQRKREVLLHRWRWFVPIGVAFISLVALIRRSITPEWVRASLEEDGRESAEGRRQVAGGAAASPPLDIYRIEADGKPSSLEMFGETARQEKREARRQRWPQVAQTYDFIEARVIPQQADKRRVRAKLISRALYPVAAVLGVGIIFVALFALTRVAQLLPRAVSWLIEWLPFAVADPTVSEGQSAHGAARTILAIA